MSDATECPTCSLLLRRVEALHANTSAAMAVNASNKDLQAHLEATQASERRLRSELMSLRHASRELIALRDLRTALRSALKQYEEEDYEED